MVKIDHTGNRVTSGPYVQGSSLSGRGRFAPLPVRSKCAGVVLAEMMPTSSSVAPPLALRAVRAGRSRVRVALSLALLASI